MLRLRFRVKGSRPEPYDLVAEGEAEQFRIFCSCPAGRLGGKFCKHAAALLVGDVTDLVEPSDSVARLRDMSRGSHFVADAMAHAPTKRGAKVGDPSFSETGDFIADIAPVAATAREKGWEVAVDSVSMACFGLTPTGRRQRSPKAWIKIEEECAENTRYHVSTPGPTGESKVVKNLSYAALVFTRSLPEA